MSRAAREAVQRLFDAPVHAKERAAIIDAAFADERAKVKALVEAVEEALCDMPDRSHFKAALVVAKRAVKEALDE